MKYPTHREELVLLVEGIIYIFQWQQSRIEHYGFKWRLLKELFPSGSGTKQKLQGPNVMEFFPLATLESQDPEFVNSCGSLSKTTT